MARPVSFAAQEAMMAQLKAYDVAVWGMNKLDAELDTLVDVRGQEDRMSAERMRLNKLIAQLRAHRRALLKIAEQCKADGRV